MAGTGRAGTTGDTAFCCSHCTDQGMEHLSQAHLHFEDTGAREFYQLVISTTPPGQPIQEIATLRPFDDPGSAAFYYRVRHYDASIVAKSHMVYELSPQRMARYRELFITPEYSVTELPSYEPHISSNPFVGFRAIPVKSRYRFLLDDAHFIIESFIKGPVCRGQIALNVIEDQFWVVFFDPDNDLSSNHPEFLDENAKYLELPSEKGDLLRIRKAWKEYAGYQRDYMNSRQAWFEKLPEMDMPVTFRKAPGSLTTRCWSASITCWLPASTCMATPDIN